MKHYITVDGTRYVIRGHQTATELRELFPKVLAKFPGTTMTFRGWLVGYGKVSCKVPR